MANDLPYAWTEEDSRLYAMWNEALNRRDEERWEQEMAADMRAADMRANAASMTSPATDANGQERQEREPLELEAGWRAQKRDLIDEDYEYGVPEPQCWEDAKLFAEDRCPHCGGAVEFYPLVSGTRRNWMTGMIERTTYQAFVICQPCDRYMEF